MKQASVTPKTEQGKLQAPRLLPEPPPDSPSTVLSLIERLTLDPSADVEKLKHVRVVARDPEKARRLLGDRTARVGVRQILIRLGADAVLSHGVALHSTLNLVASLCLAMHQPASPKCGWLLR